MSMLTRVSSFATRVVSLRGVCLLLYQSDSVRTFHEARLTSVKMLRQVGLGLSGPRSRFGFTPGPSCVRGRDPCTRREVCVSSSMSLARLRLQLG